MQIFEPIRETSLSRCGDSTAGLKEAPKRKGGAVEHRPGLKKRVV
jgi:hypothetical protein